MRPLQMQRHLAVARRGGAGAPVFEFLDEIAPASMAFSARDPATITEAGGFVSSWQCRAVPTRFALQAVPTSQPARGADYLDFDGVDDGLTVTETGLLDWTTGTLVVVCRPGDNATALKIVYQIRNGAGGRTRYNYTANETNAYQITGASQNLSITAGGSRTNTLTATISTWAPGTGGTVTTELGTVVSDASYDGPISLVYDGIDIGFFAASNFMIGRVHEIYLYPTVLSAEEIASVKASLRVNYSQPTWFP